MGGECELYQSVCTLICLVFRNILFRIIKISFAVDVQNALPIALP